MWLWQYLELKIILASLSSCCSSCALKFIYAVICLYYIYIFIYTSQEIHVVLSASVWWRKHVKWKRQLTLSFHFVGFLNQIKNKVLQSSPCLCHECGLVCWSTRDYKGERAPEVSELKGFFCLFVLKLVFFQNLCVTDKSSTSGLIQQQIRHWWA